MELLQKLGGRLYQPVPSDSIEGHYKTYMECDSFHRHNKLPPVDSHQPSQDSIDLGICTTAGCQGYRFLSESDKKRHLRLAHGGKRGAEGEGTSGNDRHFKCHICKSKFATDYRLRQHKR